MPKRLSALLDSINITGIAGKKDSEIEGIAYDSRSVKKNYAFFALDGIHTDGHKYIDSAIENGASAVFVSHIPDKINDGTAYIAVENTRKAMAFFSSAFYGNPQEKIKIIGVTGTDGKSTTVSFIYQLLNLLGEKTGLISTIEYDCEGKLEKNPYRQSTPESPEIMDILSRMAGNSFKFAVIESTSHGLSEKTARLSAIKYTAAVLTNITHEHLEFHGTMEKYIDDKANLFRKTDGYCVVNLNEPAGKYFTDAASSPVYSYAIDNSKADIWASSVEPLPSGGSSRGFLFDTYYRGKKERCTLLMPGVFNIENFLAAAITVSLVTEKDICEIARLSEFLKPVTGRMETVNAGQDFTVIVDYAHTPGAFEKIFPLIRNSTPGKLIAVFGSAGERDVRKRGVQGEIASKYCDVIILTDEDPRGEGSIAIIDQIASGISSAFDRSSLYKIPDRQQAINRAVEIAGNRDTVLLLGKGHESSIIYKEGPQYWNEREAAEKALALSGYFLSGITSES